MSYFLEVYNALHGLKWNSSSILGDEIDII